MSHTIPRTTRVFKQRPPPQSRPSRPRPHSYPPTRGPTKSDRTRFLTPLSTRSSWARPMRLRFHQYFPSSTRSHLIPTLRLREQPSLPPQMTAFASLPLADIPVIMCTRAFDRPSTLKKVSRTCILDSMFDPQDTDSISWSILAKRPSFAQPVSAVSPLPVTAIDMSLAAQWHGRSKRRCKNVPNVHPTHPGIRLTSKHRAYRGTATSRGDRHRGKGTRVYLRCFKGEPGISSVAP